MTVLAGVALAGRARLERWPRFGVWAGSTLHPIVVGPDPLPLLYAVAVGAVVAAVGLRVGGPRRVPSAAR